MADISACIESDKITKEEETRSGGGGGKREEGEKEANER